MKAKVIMAVAPVLLTATLMLASAGPAAARPLYWYSTTYTARHGFIVKAGNDSYTHTIRTKCHWYAAGTSWSTNWVLYPGHWGWTTSDNGSYGDFAATGLRCSYTIIG